jgi:hypothetical protein
LSPLPELPLMLCSQQSWPFLALSFKTIPAFLPTMQIQSQFYVFRYLSQQHPTPSTNLGLSPFYAAITIPQTG